MQFFSLAYLRTHLDEALASLDTGEVVVALDSGENAVLIKEADLRSLQETVHLLANPLNAERLQASLQQVRMEFLTASDLK
jgi:antitoxin YefM